MANRRYTYDSRLDQAYQNLEIQPQRDSFDDDQLARFGAHDNATEAKFKRCRAASEGVNGTVNLQMELRTAAERQVWRQGAAERRGAAEGQIDKAIAQSQATRETRHHQVEKQSQILEVQQRECEQPLRMIAQDRQDRQEHQQRQRQFGPLPQGYNLLRPSSPELGRGARENKRKPLTTEETLTRMFPPEVLQLQAETSGRKPAETEQKDESETEDDWVLVEH